MRGISCNTLAPLGSFTAEPLAHVVELFITKMRPQQFHSNLSWQVIIDFNLVSLLILIFYLSTNNSLSYRIYCENIVDIIFFVF